MLTSLAQNMEDVILGRVLGDVKNGTYIDVGAQDPNSNSVSLAFYKQGWSGLNIEPVFSYHQELQKCRLEDLNLNIALGATEGKAELYCVPGTGLSTFVKGIAEAHRQNGFEIENSVVEIRTLDWLFQTHVKGEVHWLKIDAEGMEKEIIFGWKQNPLRPWVLVVESIDPVLKKENHTLWEPLVLQKGYKFAYFDGLNRFYVHESQGFRAAFFRQPPNIFDVNALTVELYLEEEVARNNLEMETLEESLEKARTRIKDLIRANDQLRTQVNMLTARNIEQQADKMEQIIELEKIRNERDNLVNSFTWKSTKAIREPIARLQRFSLSVLRHTKNITLNGLHLILKFPRIQYKVNQVIRFLRLESMANELYSKLLNTPSHLSAKTLLGPRFVEKQVSSREHLSIRGRQIYDLLIESGEV